MLKHNIWHKELCKLCILYYNDQKNYSRITNKLYLNFKGNTEIVSTESTFFCGFLTFGCPSTSLTSFVHLYSFFIQIYTFRRRLTEIYIYV